MPNIWECFNKKKKKKEKEKEKKGRKKCVMLHKNPTTDQELSTIS